MGSLYRCARAPDALLPCKVKKQYLLTCKVSRYRILALHSSTAITVGYTGFNRKPNKPGEGVTTGSNPLGIIAPLPLLCAPLYH